MAYKCKNCNIENEFRECIKCGRTLAGRPIGTVKGKKTAITIYVEPETAEKLDKAAGAKGVIVDKLVRNYGHDLN